MQFRILFALMVALVLVGCGSRSPDANLQPLADAQHASEALASSSTGQTSDVAHAIADDIGAYVIASGLALPEPSTIAKSASTAQGAALYAAHAADRKAAAVSAASAGKWAAIGAAAITAIGIALRLGRNLPGVAGMALSLADSGWKMWAPDKAKKAEAAQANALRQAVAFGTTAAAIAGTVPALLPHLEKLKDRAEKFAALTGTAPIIKGLLAEAKFTATTTSPPASL